MYTPHELRTAIRNCNTPTELQLLSDIVFVELESCYSALVRNALFTAVSLRKKDLQHNTPTNAE